VTGKFKIIITRHAQTDLEHIFDYIAADSVNNATRFAIELEKKVYSLAAFPDRHPLIPENVFFGTEYRHLIVKKYRIIYRIEEASVYILRIIHGARILKV
jgi:addiction module RelE/StbE family toxin